MSKIPEGKKTRTFSGVARRAPLVVAKKVAVAPMRIAKEAAENHPELASQLSPAELRFLSYYYALGSASEAYRKLRPASSDHGCYQMGSKMWCGIKAKLSSEDLWNLMGVSYSLIGRVVKEAAEANYVREYLNTKTGVVIEGKERVDHSTRLEAAKLAARLLKAGEEDAQTLVVTVTNFAPAGAAPWPKSGADPGSTEIDVTPSSTDDFDNVETRGRGKQ